MILDEQSPSSTSTQRPAPLPTPAAGELEERERNRSSRPQPKKPANEREIDETDDYNGDENAEALDGIAGVLTHKPDRQVREEIERH